MVTKLEVMGSLAIALTFTTVALSCAFPACADTFGTTPNTFDIEFVTIGDPNNAPDTTGTPNPAVNGQ